MLKRDSIASPFKPNFEKISKDPGISNPVFAYDPAGQGPSIRFPAMPGW
jgi:hypothetical protein